MLYMDIHNQASWFGSNRLVSLTIIIRLQLMERNPLSFSNYPGGISNAPGVFFCDFYMSSELDFAIEALS